MTYQDYKSAIDFTRHHLTHVDPMIFGDDRLNLELFVDFGHIVAPLLQRLIKKRNETELNSDY